MEDELAPSTWRYSLLAWRNCSSFHRSFRKSWQVLSSSFCENLGTLVPWVVPPFNKQMCLRKNHFANDSLWTKRILNHLMAIRNRFEKQSKGNDLVSFPGTLRLSGTAWLLLETSKHEMIINFDYSELTFS